MREGSLTTAAPSCGTCGEKDHYIHCEPACLHVLQVCNVQHMERERATYLIAFFVVVSVAVSDCSLAVVIAIITTTRHTAAL